MKAVCPNCGKRIAADDINVSADRALCRTCDELFALSDLADTSEAFVPLDSPPRGIRIEDFGGDPLIMVSLRQPVVIFLIVFAAIWSGGSMTGMVFTFLEQGFGLHLLFFLPFFLGTLALLTIISLLLFGRSEARISGGDLMLFTGVGPIGRRRQMPFSEVDRIWMAYGNTQVNNRPVKEIFIGRGEDQKPWKFGLMMNEQKRACVYNWLRSQKRHYSRGGGISGPRPISQFM